MKGIDRNKILKEIILLCHAIKGIPPKQIDNNVRDNIIIARNHLRAVRLDGRETE